MTLFQIVHIILKRILLLIVFALISTLASGLISWYAMEDIYEASSTIIVSNQQKGNIVNQLTYSDYNLNIQLVNSYRVLCKTDRVLKQVISELGLPLSTTQLASKIAVTSENQTQIIKLCVRESNPKQTQLIVNTLALVFRQEVISIMKMDNVQVIDFAALPTEPIMPNRVENLIIGFFTGTLIGILVAFMLEYFDKSIKTTEQIEQILNIPILGVVPHITRIND